MSKTASLRKPFFLLQFHYGTEENNTSNFSFYLASSAPPDRSSTARRTKNCQAFF